ncbi:2,4-dienoyl-CoA reductase-like NADH-dependent reductase (Old Yellow Enzyme family) [Paenibacillus phyllosphaerae]|uniref:2,4-dienoyl-CoA reductase-like NADH-dependent reductase (Old Yellow Enzyme family) n=1 Tax=Paenibacillus phyllosphaerae TaxID=274593 RepID=A0A7W5AU23_9BACL|nr:NADH-dependent flavin oxidoreductase [Paenibacillus phyllosphaerae]MBB3108668.1 2,4-dienoyl-CoA reductase-like NADH-dependent reductase (Old Yellow Enzyme family) [Paenibacillus phyllosphaerae]
MKPQYQPLFDSFKLKSGVELNNRLVMAPMTNFSSDEAGHVSDAELSYYEHRSAGVGLVITACTFVTANGKGFHGEFAGHQDEFVPSLKRLADGIKSKGAKAILQIFHAGRQAPAALVPNGDVVSASAVSSEQNPSVTPRELSEAEIESIIRDFGETTRRAIEAGYDGVEIHGANGYLIQQFFSPHANRREDRWGGDLEKRLAFPLAVVREVKRVVAEHAKAPFAVGYRFSPEEAETPGITMEETFRLLDTLALEELDYLHVSLMEFWSAPRRGADESKSRIEWIVDRVAGRVPVIGVGSIHTPDEAAKAFESGIELLALGRELIIEPHWVQKVRDGQESDIATTLTRNDQERLNVPTPLWQAIVNTPGWFPVAD